MSLYIVDSDFRTIDRLLHFFLAMAGLPANTAELEVYLTHLKHRGCKFGLLHLDCWIHMEIRSKSTKERIHRTKFLERQFQDLETVSMVAYKYYVACEVAQSGYNKS
jgi:hypothetical protein